MAGQAGQGCTTGGDCGLQLVGAEANPAPKTCVAAYLCR